MAARSRLSEQTDQNYVTKPRRAVDLHPPRGLIELVTFGVGRHTDKLTSWTRKIGANAYHTKLCGFSVNLSCDKLALGFHRVSRRVQMGGGLGVCNKGARRATHFRSETGHQWLPEIGVGCSWRSPSSACKRRRFASKYSHKTCRPSLSGRWCSAFSSSVTPCCCSSTTAGNKWSNDTKLMVVYRLGKAASKGGVTCSFCSKRISLPTASCSSLASASIRCRRSSAVAGV